MSISPSQIVLTSDKPRLTVIGLLGPDRPKVIGGYGGWQTTPRPRRVAITLWEGVDPIKVKFQLVLDNFINSISIEEDCANLEKMGLSSGANKPPPIITASGPMMQHPELKYIMSDLVWDEAESNDETGERIRQIASIELTQYIRGNRETDQRASAVVAERVRGGAKTRQYVAKDGDTLPRIAADVLGDHKKWKDIATLNGLRDPNALTAGQTIRIPV